MIYVASSWRNEWQPRVVQLLRDIGQDVYDFRKPSSGDHGFHWSELDKNWKQWSLYEYRKALQHPIAVTGFKKDMAALECANACVLVLPCGRSAHLEAGYCVGKGAELVILCLENIEPELMYNMAYHICLSMNELKLFFEQ